MKSAVLLAIIAAPAVAQNFEARALEISREIQARHIPFGTILDPMYASADSSQIVTYTRCGDSAIWTGHWLAAETFRYAVTKSPEALAAALLALDGIERLVEVTGSNNLLARCVVDPQSPLAAGPRSEERHHREYSGQFRGQSLLWIGNTSRDQYMGVFFGLSVAHEHIADSPVRARINTLTTRLIERLIEKNWVVVMPDGRISTLFWHRPDQQLAMLQVGRQVNPQRFAALYDTSRRNAVGVDTVISLETRNQHDSYFKFNLAAITFFNLLRLEEADSPQRQGYLQAYGTFRRAVAQHGNAFFNVVDRALAGPDPRREAETQQLLAAWLQRPRRDNWVDLRGKYTACGEDRACEPIPVPERVRTDFLWQRSPFLLYGGGEGRIEAPGVDFILPYWMSRYYAGGSQMRVVSAASGMSMLAPESIASLYASGLDAGSRVTVTDAAGVLRPVDVLFAGADQINFIVPAESSTGRARVAVLGAGGRELHAAEVELTTTAPGLFSANNSGGGVAAAIAVQPEFGRLVEVPVFRCTQPSVCVPQSLSPVSDRPVYLSLYGTGVRRARSITVALGEAALPVLFAGAHGQFAGLDQINVRLDASLRGSGEQQVTVTADGRASNAVTLLVN